LILVVYVDKGGGRCQHRPRFEGAVIPRIERTHAHNVERTHAHNVERTNAHTSSARTRAQEGRAG